MGDRLSIKGVFLPVLLVLAFSLFLTSGHTQERGEKAGPGVNPRRDAGALDLDTQGEAETVGRLGVRLKRLRTIGDVEGARQLFGRLFPAEPVPDPEVLVKTAGARRSNRIEIPSLPAKVPAGSEGLVPVFASPEHETNPSADLWRGTSEEWTIATAAEQWADGWPRDLRIRLSSDSGQTWSDTVVLGDGRPWTGPSLRRISDGTIGMAFMKDWGGGDRDIYFARLSENLTSDAEFPVALSRLDQSHPALTTDYPAYSEPYIYLVYS
jgi:hypothetical protein